MSCKVDDTRLLEDIGFGVFIGCSLLALLGWLIYGSVLVYGMKDLPFEEDPSQPNYCQYSVYLVARIFNAFRK